MLQPSVDLKENANDYHEPYLKEGGEMGALTRAYDWSSTSLGATGGWPQSLLTTLGIILNSKFPMFLFWGPEHICFYNDAYRPSLGNNGKHPYSLGKSALAVWPEIWPDIKPLIDKALSGKGGSWSEDQLLPIYRNGQMEDVYWTFSYSPIIGEEGKPAGVLVTCVETTEKISTARKLLESEKKFRNMILQAPAAMCIFRGPAYVVDIVNNRMLEFWGKSLGDVLNKPVFEGLPEAKNHGFEEKLFMAYTRGETTSANGVLVELPREEGTEIAYVNFVYEPYKEADGTISGVMAVANEVTQQVLARRTIQEAEEKARLAISSAELGVYELVYGVNEMTMDKRFNELFGFDKAVSREKYVASLHPGDLLTREMAHKLSLQTGHLRYETRVIWPDKSLHWLRITGKVIFDDGGKPYRLIGVVQDITQQTLAQKKVEESERSIRNIIYQAPVAMCILRGARYVVEIANNKMLEVWGKEGEDVMNKPIFEGMPEIKKQGVGQLLSGVFTTGERYIENERSINLPRNGKLELVYVNFVYEPMVDGDGTISGILVIAIEVTAQVVARQKIEVAEERARLAVNSAELGVFEVDLKAGEAVTDRRFNEIFGCEQGATWKELISRIHPEDLAIRQKAHKVALETGVLDYEARLLKNDQSVSWIRGKGIIVYDQKGEALRLLGVAQDITAQKQFAKSLEQKVSERTKELAEANLQLQQSNIELNQFAYIASHDLQEPLRKVRTFTELLGLSLTDIQGDTKRYIDKIQDSTERMQKLINDVLKFSLLSKERENFETVDLNRILLNVLGDYELLIEQKEARINIGSLPVIEAIPVQVNQLFTNLVSNALKFCSEERKLEVTISSKLLTREDVQQHIGLNEDRPHFEIEFCDNGIGFNQEYAQQIFAIFQRLHGKKEYAGTGIGLAMCKKIAVNHHGTIYANARLNEGSTFTIILPQVQTVGD